MDHDRTSQHALDVDTRTVTRGVLLVAAGGVIAFAGASMVAGAVVTAVRRRMDDMDMPPRQFMTETVHRAKHASQAGMHAWQDAAHDHHHHAGH